MEENGVVSVVVTAGGLGRRFGGATPKQFMELDGMPVLARALSVFDRMAAITTIAVAVPEGYEGTTQTDIVEAYRLQKVKAVVTGGVNRQASVYNALRALPARTGVVLIHDGARPFVTERVICDVIAAARQGYAALTGVRATDTIKVTNAEGFVVSTPSRDSLWQVQTPQGFAYDLIMRAHARAADAGFVGTDDGTLVERWDQAPVKMVEGDRHNIKITTPEDLYIGRYLLSIHKAGL